jgi:hypothetical protein
MVPPPELVEQWTAQGVNREAGTSFMTWFATQAARWGADQELEECCEWVSKYLPYLGDFPMPEDKLRARRRPKSPSLKEQALAALSRADKDALTNPLTGKVVDLRTILSKEQSDTIRKALEALPDD